MARSRTTFVKGQSGNPSGRPKADIDIAKVARQHGPAAIETLVAALKHPRLCVAAAQALLDRGWGRPAQMVQGDSNRPLVVDFRWGDDTAVATAVHPVIEAAVEVEAEPALSWQGD